MRRERGITLVALIITIIILVILSAVTIQNTIGEHGLIDMATEAAIRTRIAEYKDELDQIGIIIMTENAPNNLKGREYLEEFKEKVDESELFKDRRSAEIMESEEGETELKLRVVTKEGFVYDVTEKETKYVGSIGEEGFKPLPEIKEGSIDIALDKNDWTKEIPIHATITVNDVAEEELSSLIIQYTRDPEAKTGWTTYAQGSKIDIETNGVIFARVMNNIGETSKTASKTISIIDTISPEDPSGTVKDKNTNSITVIATAKDAVGTDETHYKEESGIAQIIIELKGEIQGQDGEQTVREPIDVSVEGTKEVSVEHTFTGLIQGKDYEITVKAVDKAGNVSEITPITGGSTETVPGLQEGSIEFTPDKSTWTQGPVYVEIKATTYTDQGYKLQYTTTSPTADDWQDYNEAEKVKMTKNGTIYARLRDDTSTDHQYGTVATATGKVSIIDTILPNEPQLESQSRATDSITVTVSAQDAPATLDNPGEHSGIAELTLNLVGTDGKKDTKQVKVDNPEGVTDNVTFTGLKQTTEYTITAIAKDKADNERTKELKLTTEKVPGGEDLQQGKIEFAYKYPKNVGEDGWSQGPVEVTITSDYTKTEQGGYKLEYTTQLPTANDWKPYNGPISMTTNGKIYARLKDTTGNAGVEATATGSVSSIDTQKPDQPTELTATDITTNSMKVTAKAIDKAETTDGKNGHSGISKIIFSISGEGKKESQPVKVSDAVTAEFSFTGLKQNTPYTITAQAIDKAGNESSVTTMNTTPSTIPVPGGETLKGGAITFGYKPRTALTEAGWTNNSVDVTITSTYTDAAQGGYKLQYAITDSDTTQPQDGDWHDYNEAEKVEMKTNGTIYARLRENISSGYQVGTKATATGKVSYIDTIAPKNPTDITAVAVEGTDGKKNCIKVEATAQDGDVTTDKPGEQGGIAKMQVQIDSGSWTDVTATSAKGATVTASYTSASQTGGAHTIKVKAIDKAGNESSAVSASSVTIDVTPPSPPTITVTDGENIDQEIYTKDITVTITPGEDSGEGATGTKQTTYSITGQEQSSGTIEGTDKKEIILTKDGDYIIKATSTDAAGNTSTETTKQVTKKSVPLRDQVDSNNYGDYVNYPVGLDIGDPGTQDDWKIFYKKGDNVFIIAADYVPNTIISTSASNAGMTQSGTYINYWNTSKNELDANYNPDILELFSIANKYTLTSFANSYCVSKLLSTNYWDDFKNPTYADYAVGGATLEMWCASWNAYLTANPNSDFKEITAGSTNNYGYYVSSGSMTGNYYLYMTGKASSLKSTQLSTLESNYSLYFPHTSAVSSCYGYWLASPSAYNNNFLMYVYNIGSVSYLKCSSNRSGLRPVVSLKSDISATKDVNGVWQLK